MDISKIEQQLEMLSIIGYTLSIQERLRLKMARADLLSKNSQLDDIKFWGKIQATSNSYYILVGLKFNQSYEFPHKNFYYSLNDFQFKQLPQLLIQHQTYSPNFNTTFFFGDPNKILVNLQGDAGQQQPPAEQPQQGQQENKNQNKNQDEDQDVKKAPKKNFTQLNRLSYVVRAIENDAQIIPRDSYRMSPQHELHLNNNFYGLNPGNALNYSNWLHFRGPQSNQARHNIQEDTVIFNSNFLDNLGYDLPHGVWSLQLDYQKKNATVRNLLWPGYYAFHRLNSSLFGGVYIGEGMKNADLAFMI